jgi:hypothetical protein
MATQVSSAIAEMTARALPGTSTMLWSGTQRTRCCSVPRFSENTRPIAIFASTRPPSPPVSLDRAPRMWQERQGRGMH